ncbi:MAG: hypothetical protein CFE21_12675 [Bacteroidetes bacterium B1(2017)]|nr:MAG: hypothetical protein CFE21_12675 [Bacteroidetes bacterium B1(2017)]
MIGFLGLHLVCILSINAATITSANNGSWNLSSTWIGGLVPSSTDNVTIALGDTVFVDNPKSILNLTVTGSLSNFSTLTITNSLTGNGTIINEINSVLNLAGTNTLMNLIATSDGNTVKYTGTSQMCKVTTYTNLTISGSGSKTFASSPLVNGVLSMEGTASISGSIILYGSNATLQYNRTISYSATSLEWPSSIVNLKITNTGAITSPNSGNLFLAGNLTINAGASLNVQRQFTVSGTSMISGIANWTSTGRTTRVMTFSGDVILNSTASWIEPGTGNGSANSFVFEGDFTNNANVFSALITTPLGHSFTGIGKTIGGGKPTTFPSVVITGTLRNTGSLNVSGILTGSGSLTNTQSGILTIGGSNTLATFDASENGNKVIYSGTAQTCHVTSYYNLTLAGSGVKTFATSPDVANILSLEGTATIGSSAINFGSSATLQYNTPNSRTVSTFEWPSTFSAAGGVVIKNTGTISLNGTKTSTISNLTIQTGATFNIASYTISIKDILVSSSANFKATTGTLNVSGNFINNGTFSYGTGTVNFNSLSDQTIYGGSYYNLVLSGSGFKSLQVGTTNIVGNLTLNGSVSCSTVVGLTIGGNFVVGDGNTIASFHAHSYPLTIMGTTAVTNHSSLIISSSIGAKLFTGFVQINLGGTWNNLSNSDIELRGGLGNNGTFLSGSGVYSFTTNAQTTTGTISIQNSTVPIITLTNANSLNIGSNITGTGTLINSATGTLTIEGAITITTLIATSAGNTVNYTGSAQTCKVTTYQNLGVSGSVAKTFATSPTVNGILTIEGTANINVISGVVTYGSSAALKYNKDAAYTATMEEWPASFVATGGVIISNVGVITLNASKTSISKLTIGIGSKLNLGGFTNTNCGSLILGNNGQIATGTWGYSGANNNNTVFFANNTGTIDVIGAIYTWTGSTSTSWNTASNWSTNLVPTSYSEVIIPSVVNQPIISSIAGLAKNLSLKSGATLTNTAGLTLTNGTLFLEGGAANSSSIIGSGTLTLGGNIILIGLGQGNNGVTIFCPITLAADRTITVNDGLTSAVDLTLSGIISGNYTFIKDGSGTLLVSGTNTFSGSCIISSGTLKLGSTMALGTIVGPTIINSGAVLDLNGFTPLTAEPITLNGSGLATMPLGALTNTGANASFSGPITLGSASTITVSASGSLTCSGSIANGSFVLSLDGAGSGTISGIISSPVAINKYGLGSWKLSGNNTYSGATTIYAGTLSAGINTNAFGINSDLIIGNVASATLNINGFSTSIGSLNGGGVNGGAVVLGAATLTIGSDNLNTDVFAGIISGTGGVTKNGVGALTLSGANTYNGTTTIGAGTLILGNPLALGSNSGITIVASGASLDLDGYTLSIAEPITLNGTGLALQPQGALMNTGVNATFSGNITLGSATTITTSISGTLTCSGTISNGSFELTLDGPGDGTISGSISTPISVIKNGSGSWTLSGANTYTGPTYINEGSLAAGRITNSFGINSAFILADVPSALLNISGFSNTIGSITGGGFNGGNVNLGTSTLTVGSDNTSPSAFAGIIIGTGAITKIGTGTLILRGANTYTGITTLSAGTLKLGASTSVLGTTNGRTTISSGAVLDLNGYTLSTAESLTLNGTGLSVSPSGALTNTGGNATYLGNITLGSATTITTCATGSLTCAGTIASGANVLTLDGVGIGTMLGNISAQNSILKKGIGSWTLSGANTYSGGTTLNAGTLNLNSQNAIGSGPLTINGGYIDNTSVGSITLSTNNVQIWNSNFVFLGTQNLDLGTGAITLAGSTTITTNANNLSVGGAISASNFNLTKLGPGAFSLGANTAAFKNLIIAEGTFTSTSNTLTLSGSFTNNGTFTNKNGTISFAGVFSQSISGETSFNNLTLNNPAGLVSISNLSVNGTLTLSSTNVSSSIGALSMSAATILTMGPNATTIGIGDVSGLVRRTSIAANTNYTFGNQFTVLNFSNTGTLPGDITMKIVLTPSHTWNSQSINRYYSIIRTGGDSANKVDIQFHYLASELNGVIENSNIDFFDYHLSNGTGHDHGHNSENTLNKWIGKSGLSLTYLITSTNNFDDLYWTLAQSTTPNYTWIGTSSKDWNLTDNWSSGVPNSSSDVIIPNASLTSFDPSLPASATINSISLANGSILNGGNSTSLTLLANSISAWMSDNAIFNYGSSTIIFAGTSATIGGIDTFYNITINTGATTSVVPSAGNKVNVINNLVVNGAFTSNGNLTLKSSATQTARLATSAGTIIGNLNVEQYFPGGKRASRFLAHPFNTAINLSQLLDDIDITGNPDGITDANIKALGIGFTPTTLNNPSSYWFNPAATSASSSSSGWVAFNSANGSGANNTWGLGEGIRVLIRGAKGEGIDVNNYTPSGTIITMSGTPNQGNNNSVSLSSLGAGSGQGFNLIGNPFASPVDISAVVYASTGSAQINKTIYTRNPYSGAYISQLLVSGNPKIIPAYTAVFIKATSGSPVLNFTQVNKATYSNETVFKKNSYITNGIQLKASIDTLEYDVLNFAFDTAFNERFEPANDAAKLNNDLFDLYSISFDLKALSTDMRPITVNSIIPLGLRLNTGSKRIRISASANTLENNLEAYLLDKYTSVLTKLDEGAYYDLTIDGTNSQSYGENRLQLVFKPEITGINQLEQEPKITLFPNPASTFIGLTIPSKFNSEFKYSIFNQIGVEVAAGSIEPSVGSPNNLSIEELASGVYYIKVTNLQTSQTITFVK